MSSLIFQVRSGSVTPWYSRGGSGFGFLSNDVAQGAIVSSADGAAGAFGAKSIKMATNNGVRCPMWEGRGNWSATGDFTVLMRMISRAATGIVTNQTLFRTSGPDFNAHSGIIVALEGAGKLYVGMYNAYGVQLGSNYVSANPVAFTQDTPIDIAISWDGTTNANGLKFAINGVVTDQFTATFAAAQMAPDNSTICGLVMGGNQTSLYMDLNELTIWEGSTDIALGTRTDFISAPNQNLLSFSDPGNVNVLSGVSYIGAGLAKVGALLSTDPGVENVRDGTIYSINSVSKTGALDFGNPSIDHTLLIGRSVSIVKGETAHVLVPLVNPDGSPSDLSANLTEIIAKLLNSDGSTLSLAWSNGGIKIMDASGGMIRLNLSAAQTALLRGSNLEIVVSQGGNVTNHEYPSAVVVTSPLL